VKYVKASNGTRLLGIPSGVEIRMLVEKSNLGSGEVEIGEITFPAGAGTEARDHRHGSIEIFYVMEGVLEQPAPGRGHARHLLLSPSGMNGETGVAVPLEGWSYAPTSGRSDARSERSSAPYVLKR
jgi:hypothetical protein